LTPRKKENPIIIIEGLRDKLHSGAKSLIGNKGYRRYLKVARESVTIDLGALSEIDVPIRFWPIGRFK